MVKITPARLGQLLLGLTVYVAVCDTWLLLGFGTRHGLNYFALISVIPAELVSVFVVVVAARATPPGVQRSGWFLLSVALALYFVGDLIGIRSWFVGRDPFPGPADICFCAFYAALCAASLFMIRAAAVRVKWLQLSLDATIFAIGFGTLFWFLVTRPATSAHTAHSLGAFLTQMYAGLDCIDRKSVV